MGQRRRRRNGPRDLNEIAYATLLRATGEVQDDEQPDEPPKDPEAVELGRSGGRKGGKARAKKLTPEQRSAIARKAAQARWANERRHADT